MQLRSWSYYYIIYLFKKKIYIYTILLFNNWTSYVKFQDWDNLPLYKSKFSKLKFKIQKNSIEVISNNLSQKAEITGICIIERGK